MGGRAVIVFLVAAGSLLLAACGGAAAPDPAKPGQAPAFEFASFDGRRFALADLAGKPVVLNFWASWCAPCRAEMPLLEAASRANSGRGVVVIGLATRDDAASARDFLAELGITYPNGLDDGNRVAARYGVAGLPVTVFIGRDGQLARRWVGAISEEQLAAFVEEIAR